jgi:RimJ/RimL family protein N-acetyltransferase
MPTDFKLRPWSMDDLPSLVKYAANFDIAKNMMDSFPHPYSEKSGIDFIEMTQRTKNLILCIEIDGEAAGSTGIHLRSDIYRKNAEIGYWLAEPFWGKGIISRVIPMIVDKGFDTFDIERIFANVFARNKASQRVLEKSGFVLEGQFEKTIFKNGQFEDEMVYAVRRENWLHQ